MAKQSWEILAEGWRTYEARLGNKKVSKTTFARQIGINDKVFRDWMLRPTRSKDAIPLKYIDVVGKALQMSQEAIDLVMSMRIRERAQDKHNPDPDCAAIMGYVARARRKAVARALGSADARHVLGIFRRAKSLHDGSLQRDNEEVVRIFEAFEDAFRRVEGLEDEERVADAAREEALTQADRQAHAQKRQHVLEVLKKDIHDRNGRSSAALGERRDAQDKIASLKGSPKRRTNAKTATKK